MSDSDPVPRFKRVLLKLSGEVLMGPQPFGVHPETIARVAAEVADVRRLGVDIALVIGGGNIFRGVSEAGRQFERGTADSVGMLATVMNGLMFQAALEKLGVETRLMSALEMRGVCEPFIHRRALRHLEKGRVVLFAAGTGHPFFSTDTAAALRALQIKADALLKGTKVDGVYSADPVKDPTATRYDTVSYQEILQKGLGVMDTAAVALCRENHLPLVVFNVRQPGNLARVIRGDELGTTVS